jgi:lipoate-protein ligase A
LADSFGTCRLVPFTRTGTWADGPHNMAADEVLLQSAKRGQASLRFYGWSQATLSLGYFQPQARRLETPLLAGLPFVRRPTGGDALVHHHELTYCLAIPAEPRRRSASPAPWLAMHSIIAAALADFGVVAQPYVATTTEAEEDRFTGFLCFEHFTAGDLIVNGAKVVGSAQRKQRGAVMQHGGILLAASPFTPSLPGIRELSGVDIDAAELVSRIVDHLRQQTGWQVRSESWTAAEERAIAALARDRYASDVWNRKR